PRPPGAVTPAQTEEAKAKKEEEEEKKKTKPVDANDPFVEARRKEAEAAERKAKADKEAAERKKEFDDAVQNAAKNPEGPTAYSNRDAGTGGPIVLPSPRQVEAKLMQNKKPTNPNDDLRPPVDFSSPPRRPIRGGGIDPTVALFEGPAISGSPNPTFIPGG